MENSWTPKKHFFFFLPLLVLAVFGVWLITQFPPLNGYQDRAIKKEIPGRQTKQRIQETAQYLSEGRTLPLQLLDISLEIDDSSIGDIQELTSRVIFTSFGKVPIPVDLRFTIKDEAGKEVHSGRHYIVVETEEVLTKKFEELDLAPGKYTLLVNTLYNIDVADEFVQDFEIVEIAKKSSSRLLFLALLLLIAVVFGYVLSVRKRKRNGTQ